MVSVFSQLWGISSEVSKRVLHKAVSRMMFQRAEICMADGNVSATVGMDNIVLITLRDL